MGGSGLKVKECMVGGRGRGKLRKKLDSESYDWKEQGEMTS